MDGVKKEKKDKDRGGVLLLQSESKNASESGGYSGAFSTFRFHPTLNYSLNYYVLFIYLNLIDF